MPRRAVIASLAAGLFLVLCAPAGAAIGVMPGVTYSHELRWTPFGPMSLYVIRAPRPTGLWGLRPALSNGTVAGRETVSSIERTLAASTTSIGVNGDFFDFSDGYPTGLLMRDGVLEHHSATGRSSIGVDAGGTLFVDRVGFAGTWTADGATHPLTGLNEPPRSNRSALFTPVWGNATPPAKDTTEVVLAPLAPALPNTDLPATVVAVKEGGGTQIPAGGGVLVGRGATRGDLAASIPGSSQVSVRLVLGTNWAGVLHALGGGPALVRDGRAILNAGEAFTRSQVVGRDPRAAVGQRRDGSIVIVAVDGRQPGWSVGISNWELATELVRRGCVTGSALDSGGSTTVAFDGRLLNRPSDPGGERPVADALLVTYDGIWAPPLATVVLSPNGDGAADSETLALKVVRPTQLTAQLVAPDGSVRDIGSGPRQPGRYALNFSGLTAAGASEREGRWRWRLVGTDDLGRTSRLGRAFTLNQTIGFLGTTPGARRISFSLAHPASVRTTIETTGGMVLKTVAAAPYGVGAIHLAWNGRDGRGRKVRGTFVVHARASNALGVADLRTRSAPR